MWIKVANGEGMLLNVENVANVMPIAPRGKPLSSYLETHPEAVATASHIEVFKGDDLEVHWPSFEEIAKLVPTINDPPP